MLPHESEVKAEIAIKYRVQLAAMGALHDAVVGMITSDTWTLQKPRGIKRFTAETMIGLLTKACKTFRAVHLLCESGLHDDASASARVLMETTVAAVFILQKKSFERTIIYHAYGLAQQLKMVNEWRRTPGLKRKCPKALYRATEEGLRQYLAMLPPGTDVTRHWSGKRGGLQEAMKSLRQGATYSSLYRHTSAISHVSDFGAHHTFDPNVGDFLWQIEPQVRGFEAPSYAARELLWTMATRIDERLGLGFADTLAPHKLTKEGVKLGNI